MPESGATDREVKQIVRDLIDEDGPKRNHTTLDEIGERDVQLLRREVSAAVRDATRRLMEPYNKRLQWLVLMTCTLAGWTAPLTYGFAYWVYFGSPPNIGMAAAMLLMVGCTVAGGLFGWWAGK